MPKCEKCGYARAVADWCTSCGSKDPFPVRKWTLRGIIAVIGAGVLLGSFVIARRTAEDRLNREKAKATSFQAPRETTPQVTPGQQ
jgi:hypothetical protein